MKQLIASILVLGSLVSASAHAHFNRNLVTQDVSISQKIDQQLKDFETNFPELNVWVVREDSAAVSAELQVLESYVRTGQPVLEPGELLNVSCCNPACGGSCRR